MQKNRVLFAGGGTLGPVTPLLAVCEAWRKADSSVEFFWAGTPHGPERAIVEKAGMAFYSLPVARLPRYPSIEWVFLPWRFTRAFVASRKILREIQPSLIASAGGYTAVPLVFAGKLMNIPVWIHQQDVEVILSNRLTAPFARLVTAAWDASLRRLPAGSVRIGNPVRPSLLVSDRQGAHERLGLDASRPTVLVLGGGGGSFWLNQITAALEGELLATANLIHLTGQGKLGGRKERRDRHRLIAELLTDDMPYALAAADIVLCRAGMGTITELAALQKAAIVVPLPRSPQEANARELERRQAAIVLQQEATSVAQVREALWSLLLDDARRRWFGERIGEFLPTRIANDLAARLAKLTKF